jgi:hypothetical protein
MPLRGHTRPGNREAARFQPQLPHQGNIFRHVMIVVVSHIACISVLDGVWAVGEAVLDAFAFAIFVPGAFYLVSGSRRAPHKVDWK